MKIIISILIMCLCFYEAQAQTITIPDANFEQFLIDEGIDSDGQINGQIATADALKVTKLGVGGGNSNIINLSGLEHFVNLEELSVWLFPFNINYLSRMTSLKKLTLTQCGLTSLNLSQNALLEELIISNPFDVDFNSNDLTFLDLSNNPNI